MKRVLKVVFGIIIFFFCGVGILSVIHQYTNDDEYMEYENTYHDDDDPYSGAYPELVYVSSNMNSRNFYRTPKIRRPIKEILLDDFGSEYHGMPIWWLEHKRQLSDHQSLSVINSVIKYLPNIRDSKHIALLAHETMIVESKLGMYTQGGCGIAQLNTASAKETLKWLKTVRKDVYRTVMSLYKSNRSFAENLKHNIPFSIAVMLEYYWKAAPDLASNTQTLTERAVLWKSVYNTPAGISSAQTYIRRVKDHHRHK